MHSLDELRTAFANRFRVDSELGEDGLGQRLLARNDRDEPLLLTALRPDLVRQMAPEAFINTLRHAMVVRHPVLLPIVEVDRTPNGILYYASPFPDGPSAADMLRDRGPFSAADAARIGRTALEGLGALHVAGLLHGRVSASTLYVTEAGASLGDNGVYQALVGSGVPAPAIIASYGRGAHMSPEQAAGELADARSDVYLLGATLYELVTGKPPFGGRTTSATLVTVLSDEEGKSIGGAQLPGNVSSALLRAIEKAPEDRWQSADAFATALSDAGSPSAPSSRRGCLPAAVATAVAAVLLQLVNA
jgi:eukaryotic-like serine/threonine-protein kinase